MRGGRWNGGETVTADRPGKTVQKPAQCVAGSTWAGRAWALWDGWGPAPGCLTLSAPAGRRAASLLPGTRRTGFTPAAVWRNSSKVKLYLGGTGTKVVWRTCSDTRPLAPGRPAAVLHKAAGCSHCFLVDAGDDLRELMMLMRNGTVVEELGGTGPQFLCPARGWQRAGCKPATAARPSPAAASHGSSKGKPSHLDEGASLT